MGAETMGLWPPRSRLTFYRGHRGGRTRLFSVRDRGFDLSDGLMLNWNHASRTVYMGLSTESKRWPRWDEKAVSWVEEVIRYDLDFDGYGVSIRRLGRLGSPGR